VSDCSLRDNPGMFESFDQPVRCSKGHLYTTIWIPLGSLKAVRLGFRRRFQRCPVGHHWAMTERLDPETLSEQEREQAAATHDLRIP
jgi:hypothetical protein